ncbi:accessory Sec system protein Asp2 [Mammaliicoccus sciuri]|uniref:accessory Sec system protein Asp2 n=1 Tax=Mammaliicoccus sciuri TaxID=1296 RepID=UPI003F575E72
MTIKIATLGSCVTRDNFNSTINPYYKKFFTIIAHQNQTSIPSLMSKKGTLEVSNEFIKKAPYFQGLLSQEFSKEFLEKLKDKQPEYLIMDLDPDVKFGLLKLNNGTMITNNPKFRGIPQIESGTKLNINEDFDSYFTLWKSAIHNFFEFMKKNVPNCKVVLIKGRFKDTFSDGTTLTKMRNDQNIPLQNYIKMNEIWDILDEYIETNFDILNLDMTKTKYNLNKNHLWGPYYLHYEDRYYNYILNSLINLLYNDSNKALDNNEKTIQRIYVGDDFHILDTKIIEVILDSDENIINLSRKNNKVYKLFKNLLNHDYIFYYHKDGISKLYKRKYINELWKRKDLCQVGDHFYTLDIPKEKNINSLDEEKKLLVIFNSMPNLENYDSYNVSDRMFPKFFGNIESKLVKNVYILRPMDLNCSHGSHYINTVNNNSMEKDITNIINKVRNDLNISKDNVVLYGVNKGGTGALYYGSKLDLKCLSVSPVLSIEDYNENDLHFLKGLRKVDISEDINKYLSVKSSRDKHIIESQNSDSTFSKIQNIKGNKLKIHNFIDNNINNQLDISRNTIPEQLTLLNVLLSNFNI